MELSLLLEYIKAFSEVTSPLLVVVFVIYTLYFKIKTQDVLNAEKLGVLQSRQLSTLIDQNTKLAVELHLVREELTEAYTIIHDMRNRVKELEHIIGLKDYILSK